MASDDMREDLIENEPTTCIDDSSTDEKTWSWLVSHQSTSWAVWVLSVSLISFKNRDSLCLLASTLLGGTRFEPFVITTRGSVSVRESTLWSNTLWLSQRIKKQLLCLVLKMFSFVFLQLLKLEQTCPQTLWLISGSGNQSRQPYFPPASS